MTRPTPPRILVVEDDVAIRRAVCRYLRRHGCRVSSAANGVDGLEAVRQEPFDLVVTDLHMPHADGLSFWRATTRLRPELRGRFLFCTAAPLPQALEEAALTERFLSKPLELVDLWLEVVKVTGLRGE